LRARPAQDTYACNVLWNDLEGGAFPGR
jgi:hypothetical protein